MLLRPAPRPRCSAQGRAIAAAVVLLVAVILGGCSDDGDGATVNDTGVEDRPTPAGG